MRIENKRMQEFLLTHGIKAKVKYIPDGSLKHTWRLYDPLQKWNNPLREKLHNLGFNGLNGPLSEYEGNGGVFSVFVYGHYELLEEERA